MRINSRLYFHNDAGWATGRALLLSIALWRRPGMMLRRRLRNAWWRLRVYLRFAVMFLFQGWSIAELRDLARGVKAAAIAGREQIKRRTRWRAHPRRWRR